MPSVLHSYEVLLDFSNDTHDCITVQLLRDYGRNTAAVMLLRPSENVTLVLESGTTYRYAVKSQTKVISVSARGWRNMRCDVSHLFTSNAAATPTSDSLASSSGVIIDRIWRDYRLYIWDGHEEPRGDTRIAAQVGAA